MKGIVWGLTQDAAWSKLQEIEENYKRYHTAKAVRRIKSFSYYEIQFDNGDVWQATRAGDFARGRKCNISYIDARIGKEIVDCIIKPCTIAGPYHAINYFYDSTDRE